MNQVSDSKYQTQLRQLGKKVFQLREALDQGLGLAAAGDRAAVRGVQAKQTIGITSTVRQLLASIPSDGFMLAVHPYEKIYNNPAVIPTEVLKYPEVPPMKEVAPHQQLEKNLEKHAERNEFYGNMEQHAQMCVLDLVPTAAADASVSNGNAGDAKRLMTVPDKILASLFATTSATRVGR